MTSSPSSSYLTVTVENDTRCSSDAFWDIYWREVILGNVILAGKLLILTQQVFLTFCAFNHYHSNPSPETINKQEVTVLPSIVDLCMMHWWQHWIISGELWDIWIISGELWDIWIISGELWDIWIISGELWDIPDFKMAKAGEKLVKLRPTMIELAISKHILEHSSTHWSTSTTRFSQNFM